MENNNSFKNSINENIQNNGLIHRVKAKIPKLNITDWNDIMEIYIDRDLKKLLSYFGDDAGKVMQILKDFGPVSVTRSDLEWFLTDTDDVQIFEISSSDINSPIQDVGDSFHKAYDIKKYSKVAIIVTTNPDFHKVKLSEIDKIVNYENVALWAYQYNEDIPLGTVRITAILAK